MKRSRSLQAGRDLLEQLQPFAAQAVFVSHEAGYSAARAGQAVDEARQYGYGRGIDFTR
jgi:hypothetical protein